MATSAECEAGARIPYAVVVFEERINTERG